MRARAGWLLALVLVCAPLVAGCASDSSPDGDARGPAPDVELREVVSGLSNPLLLTSANDGTGRLFVVEQPGRVQVLEDGEIVDEPYLDVTDRVKSGGEQGLLGLAFAPGFEQTGRLLISYTDLGGDSVLERFTVDEPTTGTPDPQAGTVVLTQEQPYSNHNGGHIVYGPDGFLYYGLGDGGSAHDPEGNAQDPSTWLGSLLRLDVSGDEATAAPGNPFTDQPGRAEIWAYGLRNPWRFSFDRATGDLYIADVGQNSWEEVNRQPASSTGGENYGWDRWEGTHVHEGDPDEAGYTFPILEYARENGRCSVTGGHVYRGDAIPALQGRYVYGDYCSGTLWAGHQTPDGWRSRTLLETQLRLTSFGEDPDGELYVISQTGSLHQLVEP